LPELWPEPLPELFWFCPDDLGDDDWGGEEAGWLCCDCDGAAVDVLLRPAPDVPDCP
jgi:hypothetical protein